MNTTSTLPPLAILGAGAWGTALAIHLARCQQRVLLWGHNAAQMTTLQLERVNTNYLPGKLLPDQIQCTADLSRALSGEAQDILIAVPSRRFSQLLQSMKAYWKPSMRLIGTSKGFDLETQQPLYTRIPEILGSVEYALLSGPSFASEVAAALPTAVTIASTSLNFAKVLQQRFHNPTFRVYTTQDVMGVSLGGTLKNVLAIAIGIADGLGFGANAQAALMTRGFAEILRLGSALGAQTETLVGLSGIGDLILTCTDNQSRNRRFGLALAQGQTVEAAQKNLGQLVEGFFSTRTVHQLAAQQAVALPICESVYQILYQHQSPSTVVNTLLNRPPGAEKISI